MTMPDWARTTIIRVRAAMASDHGNLVPDWARTERLPIPQCLIEDAGGADSYDHRTGKRVDLTITAPHGCDVHGDDRVEVPGYRRAFEVVGEPTLIDSPTGALDHTLIRLTAQEG